MAAPHPAMPKYSSWQVRANVLSGVATGDVSVIPLAHQVPEGWRGQAATFDDIFLVFLMLGTLVGAVVIGYMIYNAYRYREGATPDADFDPPELGELPTGGKGGRKLFLSFTISAIIVIGLVAWTYTALLWVEQGATQDVETEYDLEIEGLQFAWQATYPNGETTLGEIYLPADTMVGLEVTSRDVWHTFGVTELRVKVDAIPGRVSTSWVLAEEGEYLAECFELCGAGHSTMEASVIVIDAEEWEAEFVEGSGDGETESLGNDAALPASATEAQEPPTRTIERYGGMT